MKYAMLAGLGILCVSAADAEPIVLTPGNWSVTIGVVANGKTHTDTMYACLTPADSNLEPVELAQAFAGGADCSASNISQNGKQITFDMSCAGSGTGLVSAELTLLNLESKFTMDGPIKLRNDLGVVGDGTMTIAAQRQGECTD